MSYRGIVKNGVIVLEAGAQLPDGTAAQVQPLADDGESLLRHSAMGIWRERADVSDAAEASRRFRKQIEERGSDA